MPRELSAAPNEHPHPYPAAARPPPSPQDPPAEPLNQPEPSPANESDDYDSDNEDWLDILDESTHNGCKSYSRLQILISPLINLQVYFSLPAYIRDNVQSLEPPTERLRCVACHRPILVPTLDMGHHPILWRLAHCRHPLYLHCLYPVGQPPQHPHYVDNSCLSHFTSFPCMMLMHHI